MIIFKPVEDAAVLRNHASRSNCLNAFASKEPNEAARLAIARHVKQITSSPAEDDSAASPLVQEAARVIDNLPPFLVRSPKRPLTMAAMVLACFRS